MPKSSMARRKDKELVNRAVTQVVINNAQIPAFHYFLAAKCCVQTFPSKCFSPMLQHLAVGVQTEELAKHWMVLNRTSNDGPTATRLPRPDHVLKRGTINLVRRRGLKLHDKDGSSSGIQCNYSVFLYLIQRSLISSPTHCQLVNDLTDMSICMPIGNRYKIIKDTPALAELTFSATLSGS